VPLPGISLTTIQVLRGIRGPPNSSSRLSKGNLKDICWSKHQSESKDLLEIHLL
jgi:hypothetical protein